MPITTGLTHFHARVYNPSLPTFQPPQKNLFKNKKRPELFTVWERGNRLTDLEHAGFLSSI